MRLGKISIFTLMLMFSACGDGKGDATTPDTETNTTQAPLVIDGYTLPPMPDKALNDSTLLGIDSNDNGVRDDVEIWIYTTYEKPIERAVFMQSAKAYQIVIEEPEEALGNLHYIHDAVDCISYYKRWADLFGEELLIEKYRNIEEEISPIQFNTKERFLSYQKYNHTLSGGVYSSAKPEDKKSKCDFNILTFK